MIWKGAEKWGFALGAQEAGWVGDPITGSLGESYLEGEKTRVRQTTLGAAGLAVTPSGRGRGGLLPVGCTVFLFCVS